MTCKASYTIKWVWVLEKLTNDMVLMSGFTKLLKAHLHSDLINTKKFGKTRQKANISVQNCFSFGLRIEVGLDNVDNTKREPWLDRDQKDV